MRIPGWLALILFLSLVALLAVGTAAGAVVLLTGFLVASVLSQRGRPKH